MALFIRLAHFTDKAIERLDQLSDMLDEAGAVMAKYGGKMLHAWSTLGPYDIVAVMEAPDETTAMLISAEIAKLGYFRATTHSASPMADFIAAISSG